MNRQNCSAKFFSFAISQFRNSKTTLTWCQRSQWLRRHDVSAAWEFTLLLKSNVRDLFVIWANRLQKKSKSLIKNCIFLYVFDRFPLFMPKSESLPSPFAHLLFLKSNLSNSLPNKRAIVSDSLRLLMTKEQWERFALFHKWIALLLFRSQKRGNCSKNRWANSQPCVSVVNYYADTVSA